MGVLGVDVGGTFTDAVLVADGEVRTAKVPTGARQEESVVAAAAAVGARDVDRFTHGTTVATNALLERRGARTAFVTNEGFEHLLHLRRQTRAHLYRPCAEHPPPLVPLERCHGVRGRDGPNGEVAALDLSSLGEIDAEAIAICLLFSFRDPGAEQELAAELRRRYPNTLVVASHEVAPEFREYERASTTVVDAYLGSILSRYLRGLASAALDAGLPVPLVMRSSGGVTTLDEAAAHASFALLSGPAAGVVGAARIARLAGFENALAFDMGGTSTDVCAIVGGHARREHERLVGGLPVRLPTLAVHTVGAGGGSIVRVDEGGALRVGPESAGAHPGPACYGQGGRHATVTDANLVLGRLPAVLPGGIELDTEAAHRALGDTDPTAVVEVVDAEMTRALRVVSVEQGLDPRDFALVAFGGAGPLHACALAEELGMTTVLVPAAAGVLSAVGLVAADERRDSVRSYVSPLDQAGELPELGEADLRYTGQSFELTVPLGPALDERFHEAHEARYGYADRSRALELVAVRTAGVRAAPPVELRGPSLEVAGPAVVELDGATAWVPEGWAGATDPHGTLVLERSG
jgi:N-methylhydantoinase A